MTLSQYLKMNGLRYAEFAARIGRSEATVSRLVRGLHRPDWDTMEAIQKETGGAVTPNDFVRDSAA